MNSDRFERGKSRLAEMQGGEVRDLLADLADISPDLCRFTIEFPYGDILTRPGLDPRSRQIATVAALTALGNAAPQLRAHIDMALNVGCKREEVVEVITQMAVYAGFPAALNGMAAAKEVFDRRDREDRS